MLNDFITGNKYKQYAHYIWDEHGFAHNHSCKNTVLTYFIKTDYINHFLNTNYIPNKPFILITHNSDYGIDSSYSKYLEYEHLIKWYAQNVSYQHDKLIPIPIGIANKQWPHGNTDTIRSVIDKNYTKNQLIYANFNIKTNINQRTHCLNNIDNSYYEYNISFDLYLEKLAKSYFSVCPMGNGIDSHRIWESLYLNTIPIVEKTIHIEYLKNQFNLPIIMLDDWKQFKDLQLNTDLYSNLIKFFDGSKLTTDLVLNID